MTPNNHYYTNAAKSLHWVIAALIVLQYILAQLAENAEESGSALRQLALLANHKSVGVTIVLLVLARIGWRIANPPPRLPASMPQWQVLASAISHWSLYALVLAVPVTGWIMSDASSYAVSWFNVFPLPDFIESSSQLEETFETAHKIAAYTLLATSVLHVLAALKHALIDRDSVVSRMTSRATVSLFFAIVAIGSVWLGSAGRSTAADATDVKPVVGETQVRSQTNEARVPAELPIWQVDYEESFIRFTGEQAGAAFDGEWTQWSAEMRFDASDLNASSFDVQIATVGVETHDDERDATLAEAEWFHSTEFPSASYRAVAFRIKAAGQFIADGHLTIKGVSFPVSLEFTLTQSGDTRLLEGTAQLDRLALNVGSGEWVDTDWVGQFVEVQVRVSAKLAGPQQNSRSKKPPNVLLILVDDLGFNDLSFYGSEIQTPNIDALARDGIALTDFHSGPTCSPTRAMLLTGADSHRVGLGWMAEVLPDHLNGRPGYEGYLNLRAASLPELLRDAGYNTYMTGKWHLGYADETSPSRRGFDKTFVLVNGGAGAFQNQLDMMPSHPTMYRENGKPVESLPNDFYSTAFYTDRMLEFIDDGRDDDKPFFAYLAYTSPHWPLQAPQASIQKYQDTYVDGYDALNQRRLARLKKTGLVEPQVEAFPRMLDEKAWNQLSAEEQRFEAKKMSIYAAMVDDVDVHIGRLIERLKSIGEYDNTLILFMSDNGPEGKNPLLLPGVEPWVAECCDNHYDNIGNADSYVMYATPWAQAGNTPHRAFKTFTSQGGLRVPAFVHFPSTFPGSRSSDAFLTVKDVLPTILDVAGIEHPGKGMYRGREVIDTDGRSMGALLRGEKSSIREPDDYMGWELFGKRAIRQGDWKIIFEGQPLFGTNKLPVAKLDTWQLYNLAEDPTEVNDLADMHPEKLEEMLKLWDDYVSRNGVYVGNLKLEG